MKIKALIINFIISVVSGILTYIGISNPFGWRFWIFPIVTLVSLITVIFLIGLILQSKTGRWKKNGGYIFLTASIILFGLVITAFYDYRIFFGQSAPRNLSKEKWKDDLNYFEQRFPKEHKDLYSLVAENDFKKAIEDFRAKIDQLSDDECKIEFLKLVASVNDGHTMLFPVDVAADFHFFPISIFNFADGYYVVKAADQYKSAVGAKVIKLGNLPIEEAFQKLKPFIGAENDWNKRDRFQTHLGVMAELLQTQKIIDDKNICHLTLQNDDGNEFELSLKAEPFFTYFYWAIVRSAGNEISPVIPNLRDDWYWFKFDEQTKNLYVQITQLDNQKSKATFKEFVERLNNEIDKQNFNKLVIDIRANLGGNNQIFRKLIEILQQPKVNQQGKLFLLTGRKTYSAGVNLTSAIVNQTKAISVGEPTGEGHNQFGDPTIFSLPNSRLKIQVSKLQHFGSIAEDKTNAIAPDILVSYNHKDFLNRIDSALKAVEDFQIANYKSDNPRISPISPTQQFPKSIVGRYLFKDSYLALVVIDENNMPSFSLGDSKYSLFRVKSELYPISDSIFLTQLNKVNLEKSTAADSLILNWNGVRLLLKKLDENFKLPMELINEGKIEEGLNLYKTNPSLINSNTEASINGFGYEYLAKKDNQNALLLFQAATELFSQSANVFDSYGEALANAGKREEAIKAYEKALQIAPGYPSAVEALSKLRGQ